MVKIPFANPRDQCHNVPGVIFAFNSNHYGHPGIPWVPILDQKRHNWPQVFLETLRSTATPWLLIQD